MGGVVGLIFRGCGRGESNRAEFLEIRGGWEDRRGGFVFFLFFFLLLLLFLPSVFGVWDSEFRVD